MTKPFETLSPTDLAAIQAILAGGDGLRASALDGLAGALARPANNMIAVAGDSRMDFGKIITAPTIYTHTARGAQHWATVISDARVRFPIEYDFAVAGTTIAQFISNQLPSVLTCPAAAVVILTGTNSVSGGVTLATMIAQYTDALTQLLRAGKLVFLYNEMPRTGSVITAAQRAALMGLRTWLKHVAPRLFPNVIAVDCWPEMADATVATIESRQAPLVMRVGDNLHPGPAGGYYAGKALAAQIVRVYPARDALSYSNADQYDATNNPYGAVTQNPAMVGTAGTIAQGSATVTGSVADNFNLTTSSAGGLTAVASKTLSANGQKISQRLQVTGTPTSTNPDVILEQFGSTMLGRVASGDVLEFFAEIVCAQSVNLKHVMAQLRLTVDGTMYYARSGERDTGANFCTPDDWSGVIRIPRLTVPAGTLTEVRVGIYIGGYVGYALTADVSISNVALRKAVA